MRTITSLLLLVAAPAGACAALADRATATELDPGFGDRGVILDDWGAPDLHDQVIRIQTDARGRTLALGAELEEYRWRAVVLARYLDDGSRDPSFGEGGVATIPLGDGSFDVYPGDFAIDDSGGILVSGSTFGVSARRYVDRPSPCGSPATASSIRPLATRGSPRSRSERQRGASIMIRSDNRSGSIDAGGRCCRVPTIHEASRSG